MQIRKDMAVLLSLQGKIARNEEKISAIREQNPQINALAFGTSTTKGNTSGSGSAPECRVAVPDAAFLVKESDSGGQGLPVMKPYVPAAPLVLVPPPVVPVEKQATTDKEKGGGGGGSGGGGSKASKSAAASGGSGSTDTVAKPAKKVVCIVTFD
jgi:hypothetical protein